MIRRERRDGGEREERELRKREEREFEKGSRERIEIERKETKGIELQFEEEDKEHRHLPLLVSSRQCVSSEFPTRFCSNKVLQQ